MSVHPTRSQVTDHAEPPWTPPPQGRWTWEDYLHLSDDPDFPYRYEIIRGHLYMTPSPNLRHQRASSRLHVAMANHAHQHRLGEVFSAPFDVLVEDVLTPVQPDLIFISEANKQVLTEQNIQGAPDLLVEIISPHRVRQDRRDKFDAYMQVKVPEFWLVDPMERRVEVFVLRDGKYVLLGKFAPGQAARSEVLAGFTIDPADICPI